jgi:hypothetical protein
VLDHLEDYPKELTFQMIERFHLAPAMSMETGPLWGN